MSEATFNKGLRGAVRGLWSGAISKSQFTSQMKATIQRNLENAWIEGASECGIAADELSDEELKARDAFIEGQYEYIGGYADAIRENDKISGEKLQPLLGRAELWLNRYGDARNQAKVLACADQKLLWIYGDTHHCQDCMNYNDRVYRASTWDRYGIRPQSPNLACHGYRCRCTLSVTDRPLTRGKPPGMHG